MWGGERRVSPLRFACASVGMTKFTLQQSLAVFRRHSRFTQFFARLRGFIGARIALDDVLQFLFSFILFAEFDQCEAFLLLRAGSFVTAGEVLQYEVVVGNRLLVVAG